MLRSLQQIMVFTELVLAADEMSGQRPSVFDRNEADSGSGSDDSNGIYSVDSDESYSEDYAGDVEPCIVSKKCFDILPGMKRTAVDLDDACEGDEIAVKLKPLYNGDDNPRKWVDLVVMYASKRVEAEIDKNVFVGVAIYAQHYGVSDEHIRMLVDNLYRLYIVPTMLVDHLCRLHNIPAIPSVSELSSGRGSLHDEIYKEDDGSLRNERELALIEGFMKTVFIEVLKTLEISFSIDGDDLKVHAKDECTVEEWCDRRNMQLTASSNTSTSFKNIIMERAPRNTFAMFGDLYVLQSIMGTIRSGQHVIFAKVDLGYFDNLIDDVRRVNTNNNLAGVTMLDCDMNLEDRLGGIKKQLRYLEIEMDSYKEERKVRISRAIDFMNGLDGAEIKATIWYHDPLMREWLMSIPRIEGIKNIRIKMVRDSGFLADQELMRSIAGNEKVLSLEIYDYSISLEKFLVQHQYLNGKLKRLGVRNIGDLSSGMMITDGQLAGLRLELLKIDVCDEDIASLNQLRSIITREGFKYLILDNVYNAQNLKKIVDLKNNLGERQWPVIIVNCMPSGYGKRNFSAIDGNRHYYELHYNPRYNNNERNYW